MIKIVKTESRYFTKSVNILRELLSFVENLDDFELLGSNATPNVVGYRVPYIACSAARIREVLDKKAKFKLSHSGAYSLLGYNYKNHRVTCTFIAGHTSVSIRSLESK
tara:strand:+ start:573 stop:896 length:324 start_codon:yes stop_codon:yes gene_type:complete